MRLKNRLTKTKNSLKGFKSIFDQKKKEAMKVRQWKLSSLRNKKKKRTK